MKARVIVKLSKAYWKVEVTCSPLTRKVPRRWRMLAAGWTASSRYSQQQNKIKNQCFNFFYCAQSHHKNVYMEALKQWTGRRKPAPNIILNRLHIFPNWINFVWVAFAFAGIWNSLRDVPISFSIQCIILPKLNFARFVQNFATSCVHTMWFCTRET